MLKIAIVAGDARLSRVGAVIAEWVNGLAGRQTDAEFELLDVADIGLPSADEGFRPAAGQYANGRTQEWAAKVASFDAFIFVTPEYDHSVPADRKDALDFTRAEWANKSAEFVQATLALRQASPEITSPDIARGPRGSHRRTALTHG